LLAAHSAAPSNMADELATLATLATEITKTEGKIAPLEQEIIKLNKRLDENDFTGSGRYSSQEKVEAALQELKAKEIQLNNQLQTLYDTRKIALTQQQQQSGAGTSMLPVRQVLVMSLLKLELHATANFVLFPSVSCRTQPCTAAACCC
jgi:chromosome segregation ATPase